MSNIHSNQISQEVNEILQQTAGTEANQQLDAFIELQRSFEAVALEPDPVRQEYLLSRGARQNKLPIEQYKRLFQLFKNPNSSLNRWTWTGLREKTLWDWLQLLIVPVMLALGAWGLQSWANQQQRQQADDEDRQKAFTAYIDSMERLMPKLEGANPEDPVRVVARARTLALLRELDGPRKGQVVQFLNEARLINKDKFIVDIGGADLSGAVFNGLKLTNIWLPKVNLQHADLQNADLQGADLTGAKLEKALLKGVNLAKANMAGVALDRELETSLQSTAKLKSKDEVDQAIAALQVVGICGAVLPSGEHPMCAGVEPISSGAPTSNDRVYIRSKPGLKSAVIEVLDPGTKLGITGATQLADGREWYQLAKGGWVDASKFAYP